MRWWTEIDVSLPRSYGCYASAVWGTETADTENGSFKEDLTYQECERLL